MRRRKLVVHSDSDEDDGEGTPTATPASASASASVSVSVASGGGGGGGSGSVGRPSPSNPSPLPVPLPSLSQSFDPVVISDDDAEEEVDEIVDSDGDSPIVDAVEVISPPPPPAPAPPPTATPFRTPTPTPPPPAPAPAPAPAPPPTTTPFRTPTPTPPPARTPTPTPPPPVPVPAPGPSPITTPFRTPTPTPPLARTPPSAALPHPSPPPPALSGRLRPVYELLRGLGLRLRPEWLESCAAGIPGFDGLGGAAAQARRCFEQFLFADMNACGAGVLPEGVGSMHATVLDGPFVLQVDEIVNMSAPLKERYRDAHAGPKRCLKLSMTDGIQRIFGMEYRPIKDLAVLAPAGLKIIIRNVHIRRGLLMLVPEVIDILGGIVDELEAARDRLVSEVNKPPRGKRKQGGLPLSSRATLAAWPCSTNVTNGGGQGISMPRAVNSSHPTGFGTIRPCSTNVTNGGEQGISMPRAVNSSHPTGLGIRRSTETVVEEHVSPPVVVNTVQEQIQRVQEINMENPSTYDTRKNTETSAHTTHEHNRTHINETSTQTIIEECVDPPIRANNAHEQIQRVQEITMQEQANVFGMTASSVSTPFGYDSRHGSHVNYGTAANDVEAARSPNVDRINHMEYSFILSGENEKPFTYICSLLNEWGTQQDTKAYIQGKIKGLITSVKSFQYRQRTKYELYVYIDDGSFISEAIVDHDIVKNMLGLSPGEVTAALAGKFELASASEVKETMRGFQRFLVKFEGMMLVEYNKDSSIPIVREFNEGCSSSNAWLLLRRLKTFSSQIHMRSLDAMDTTP
ncbi:hypothetical protein PAHAL_7G126700 [Panicum hallii]|uniref:RecQ-mediated genome instability protein 1 n=1 Tax=Panicum hallii TaxID=206008 RepID=A0A2S3I667_9POAL|nr:recQ-mediated genome instability protein 1-like [Panicum hallii]PAN37836.1 hypothetical protein PAHAL_7G126700 [Panicum hallii]